MSRHDDLAVVAHKIFKKYGVFIHAETLSNEAIQRVLSLKNFPRVSPGDNLRLWNDKVFGEGERVDIYLPRTIHPNTFLSSAQSVSAALREGFHHYKTVVTQDVLSELEAEEEEDAFVEPAEHQETEHAAQTVNRYSLDENLLGLNLLHHLSDIQHDQQYDLSIIKALENTISEINDASPAKERQAANVYNAVESLLNKLDKTIKMLKKNSADAGQTSA